jgi:SAM-dependent methyltransferase
MWSTPARLHTYCQYLYRDVPLNGMQVLDIGAGSGVFSLYAAAAGASRVVCLEPEAAGSREGKLATFGRVVEASGIQSVEMRDVTLQDYDSGGERFDLLLLHGSINHLDEPACIELRKNPEALRTYEGLFASMAELTAPGGHLLLVDATSDNLWPRLGLKNPMAPWIEWHKHQPPEVWRGLAEAAGFRYCCTQWSTPSVLGSVGRVLLGNRIGAYLTLGAFRLHMRKPA